jgi:hypothetical protein
MKARDAINSWPVGWLEPPPARQNCDDGKALAAFVRQSLLSSVPKKPQCQ